MRIKTIIILVVAILLAIVIFQNTGQVRFAFLFTDFYVSKLVMMLMIAVVAFILGYLAGRPKNIRKLGGNFTDDSNTTNTLSNEDKDYIN
jgi:uncharacterized integral membrane protein